MIIDRSWNKQTQNYVISYLDDHGNRKMWNRYMHHWTTYEFDENGKRWSSTMCFAWFVWEKGYIGQPIINWI